MKPDPLCFPARTQKWRVRGHVKRGRRGLATICRCLPEATHTQGLSRVSLENRHIHDPHEVGDRSLRGLALARNP